MLWVDWLNFIQSSRSLKQTHACLKICTRTYETSGEKNLFEICF